MARPGYLEARNAVETATLDLDEVQARLAEAQAMPDTSEAEHVLRSFHIGLAQDALDRRQAILDNAKDVLAAFQTKSKTRRGPRQYFAATRSIMLSATQPMLDAMDSHCASERISVPELIRRALAAYLKLGV